VADIAVGHRVSFGEVSCRIHCIERNVAAIWRKSVAPSPYLAPPQPKCESIIRRYSQTADQYGVLAEAEELGTILRRLGFNRSDLTDGVSRTPRTVRPKDPRAVATTRTPLRAALGSILFRWEATHHVNVEVRARLALTTRLRRLGPITTSLASGLDAPEPATGAPS
jgi:hypothetical protein